MTHEPDFASRLVGTIQERELAPKARWTYVVRSAFMLALLVISVILGALTVATSEFLLVDRDWDLAAELGQRNTIATIQSLPYLWLAALLLLVVVTYNLLTRTRRGYRFAPVTVLGGSVLMSLALGSGLYAAGVGPSTHEYARRAVPAYDRLVISREHFWSNPQQGLLGGVVLGATTTEEFLLQDGRGAIWLVQVTGNEDAVAVGNYVRVIGFLNGTSTFSADNVLPWERRAVLVPTE